MVKEINPAVWLICSYAMAAPPPPTPTDFWEVMQEWGCDWLWKDLQLVGPMEWLADAIAEGSCIGAMDGSYMQTLREDICSVAFFFESSDRSCKLVGAFAELSIVANAYRGELLGLMALHLILLAVNEVNPGLKGEITLHSDCLGAISRIEDLPPGKIPSACKHADILKNILIACKRLTFDIVLEHVEAHQDDGMEFYMLTRAAQLNCAVDAGAKRALLSAIEKNVTSDQALSFPIGTNHLFFRRAQTHPRYESVYAFLGPKATGEEGTLGPKDHLDVTIRQD
jgi:hypothetical protein